MHTDFQIKALDDQAFSMLFHLDAAALAEMGIVRQIVDSKPGFPCRVSLQDAEVGDEVLLLPYAHHVSHSPYQASGPIYVRKGVPTAHLKPNEIPKMLEHRLLSVRGYNRTGMMLEATVVKGQQLRTSIFQLFERPEIVYAHIHNARPGCYNCLVERAVR